MARKLIHQAVKNGTTMCPSLYKQDSQLTSKGANPYKIIVPTKVEKIIRYFCAQSPMNEWSGVLFYKVEGNFDSELKVICEDIFLMDVGNSAYTEYKFSNADIATYLVDNPELLDCYQGLIHSHDTMSTFFSGTDSRTLQAEGNDTPIFVSLIVNNAGKYTAGITRKIKFKNTLVKEGEYQFYQETKQAPKETLHSESTELEWFDLEVIKEDYSQHDPLAARFCEVVQAKTRASAQTKAIQSTFSAKSSSLFPKGEYKERSLFPEEEMRTPIGAYGDYVPKWEMPGYPKTSKEDILADPEDEKPDFVKEFEDYADNSISDIYKLVPNEEHLMDYIKQLVTGSPIINPQLIDLEKWLPKMDAIYDKRFGDDGLMDKGFETWFTDYANFIVQDFEDPCYEEVNEDEVELASIFAYHAEAKLRELNDKCEKQTGKRSTYADAMCDELIMWYQ